MEAPPERGGHHTKKYVQGFVRCPRLQGGPPERGRFRKTILFARFRAPPTPPGRPRLSEEGIKNHIIFKVSFPSHPSEEAPPDRGGYRKTIQFTRFRAPPTPSRRPHLSEEGIKNHTLYKVLCPSHPSKEAPPKRGGWRKTILFTRCPAPPAPPGKFRLSEEGIEYLTMYEASCPSHASREVPPERGGRRRNTSYKVSRPSHASREAPPERGGYRKTIIFTRCRASPTRPGRPRLSEECIGKT